MDLQKKTRLQQRAADLLSQHKRLITRWATGCGKSNIVMRFLTDHPGSCLIVVPETNNIDNWRYEFRKWNVPDDNVEVTCYASIEKYVGTQWHLITFDEAPHVNTQKKIDAMTFIEGDHVLALGAILSEDEEKALRHVYGDFFNTEITLDYAIRNELLPEPEIYVIHLQLDNETRNIKYSGKMVTQWDKYQAIHANVKKAADKYALTHNPFWAQRMNTLGNERKKFLGMLKTDAARVICTNLEKKNRRYLCFCSSIEQTQILGGDHSFTSHTPASLNILNRFNDHDVDSLFVVGKLIEGQNLKDIDAGVLIQLGGKDRITVQSMGRILRSERPRIYVLCFDNTKDEDYLCTLTNNISSDYIKHFNFSDIT